MLLPHVHIPSSISCVLFAAVVEAWKLFLKLLGTPPDMLLPLVFSPGISHFNIVYQVVHQLLTLVFVSEALDRDVKVTTGLGYWTWLLHWLVFEVIVELSTQSNGVDVFRWDTELGNVGHLERLKYLLGFLVILTSRAGCYLFVEVALFPIRRLRVLALLNPLSAGFIRALPFNQLWNKLFTNLWRRLMCQNGSSNIIPIFIGYHMREVSVLHVLVQF